MRKRNVIPSMLILFLVILNEAIASGQELRDTLDVAPGLEVMVIKNDNTRYAGYLIYQDARELIILTDKLGELAIPKHEIKEIRELKPGSISRGVSGAEQFSTRYSLTTNGLPLSRGENYIDYSFFGPDMQLGITDNIGVGLMTTWLTVPIIGTFKYSRPLGEKSHLALGGLLGTGSWVRPDFGLMLPFAALTYGNTLHNVNFSAGFGLLFNTRTTQDFITDRETKERNREGRLLFSVAGMTRVAPAISLVLDSFIMPAGKYQTRREWVYDEPTDRFRILEVTERSSGIAVFSPGIRWYNKPDSAWQFGFTGVFYEGESMPFPLIQKFRSF